MTERIGKYRIKQDNENLRITYIYTFSDLFGGFFYLVGFLFGLASLYVVFKEFTIESVYNFSFWFVFLIGAALFGYFLYVLTLSLYNPGSGIIQINKQKGELIIRDFLKETVIATSSIVSIYCELSETSRPKQKFGTFTIGTKDGKRIGCFIVRSSIPLDIGKKIEKEIYETTVKLRTKILEFIRS